MQTGVGCTYSTSSLWFFGACVPLLHKTHTCRAQLAEQNVWVSGRPVVSGRGAVRFTLCGRVPGSVCVCVCGGVLGWWWWWLEGLERT